MTGPEDRHGAPSRRDRLCLTPVRNEAWIIDRFLSAATSWANHVIVADQGSTDGTLAKLERTGVDVVINDSPAYDEDHRQRLLINRARQLGTNRILIGLDADEALSANVLSSEEWRRLESAAPGTILRFKWVNILPGFERAWIPQEPRAFGFVDDGAEHHGKRIHSPRLPQPAGAPVIDLEDVVVLHFQYAAWERMVSKHRWYQAWEHVKHQQKGPLQIFREYHHMYGGWDQAEIHAVKPEWLDGYSRLGIDFRSIDAESVTWWDSEVLQMLRQCGPEHFRRIDIWDKDWGVLLAAAGESERERFADPRSIFDRMAHRMLRATQGYRSRLVVRAFERCLRYAGW